jgi:hypothetical protein
VEKALTKASFSHCCTSCSWTGSSKSSTSSNTNTKYCTRTLKSWPSKDPWYLYANTSTFFFY